MDIIKSLFYFLLNHVLNLLNNTFNNQTLICNIRKGTNMLTLSLYKLIIGIGFSILFRKKTILILKTALKCIV